MKRIRFGRNFLFFVFFAFLIMALFWGSTFSSKARADASCNALLSELNQHLQLPRGEVEVLHMTNYQANNQWWGGYTKANLRMVENGHLIGKGDRLISLRTITIGTGFGQLQPFSIKNPDPISYDIDPQSGKITFQGRYTHDMTCIGNKFAVVGIAGGDAFETFTFSKVFAPVVR